LLFSLILFVAHVASQFADVQVTGVATGNTAPVDSATLLPPPIMPPDHPPQQVIPPPLPPVDNTPPVTPPAQGQCDPSNGRRVGANSPYARSLSFRGVQLVPCSTPYTPATPRPSGYTPRPSGYTQQCDPNTGRRVNGNSIYARSLVARGVQLVPCSQTTPATPRPAGYAPRPSGYVQQCDPNTGRRVNGNSIYARSLVARGVQLVPCSQTTPATPRPAGYAPRQSGAQCDPTTGRRVNVNSPYGRSLVARGVQFTNCPAAALSDQANEYSGSSASTTTPAWAIALIVLGSIVLVAMVVVMVQLFKLVRKY